VYSDRISKRREQWWRDGYTGRGLFDHLRRLEMLHVPVRRDAPLERWRRGLHWQRRLLNKLNAREFVQGRHCAVPALYWTGRIITRSVLQALPRRFVLKPALGAARQGVYVMDDQTELLTGATMTREQLFDHVIRQRGRFSHIPLLVEELLDNELGEFCLAVDYKFHVFGDTIGAIEAIHRSSGPHRPSVHRCYTAQWEPIADPLYDFTPLGPVTEPPRCLPQLLATALALGGVLDTYMRVDLYATSRGGVFGEFSSLPLNGQTYTPYAEQLFENLWQQKFPDSV